MPAAAATQAGWKLIISKWIQYRSPRQIEQAEAKVNEILCHNTYTEEEKVDSIRDWFAYYDILDVTTMLELAIWRCNNGKEQNAVRQASRRNCGSDMNIISRACYSFWRGSIGSTRDSRGS